MKKTISESETAGKIEQKVPSARGLAHFVTNVSSGAEFPGTMTIANPASEQVVATAAVAAPAGLSRAERLYQSILPELTMVKTVRPDSLSVVLKPDRDTEIFMRVTIEDGRMHAYARCDRGDIGALNAEWGSLQKSLASQGVELSDLNGRLATTSPENQLSNSNSSHQQSKFQREREPASEPALAEKRIGMALKRVPRSSKIVTGAHQLLESWA